MKKITFFKKVHRSWENIFPTFLNAQQRRGWGENKKKKKTYQRIFLLFSVKNGDNIYKFLKAMRGEPGNIKNSTSTP